MKLLHPNRVLYVLFGIGAFLVLMVGAAAWHVLIDGNSLDCSMKGIICLFIPDRSDWYIHLISYALMSPFILAISLAFTAWRRQWTRLNLLTRNLAILTTNDSKLETAAFHLDLTDKVTLLDSTDFVCFCANFRSPRIYVSRPVVDALKTDELEALLLHEKFHLQNCDPLRILLGRLTVSALFFVPVLKDLFKRYLIRKEIAADQFAIRFQGQRRGIIGALQKLLEQQSYADSTGFAVSGTEALKYRVDYMLGHKGQETITLRRLALSFIMPAFLIFSMVASLTILNV
jgi:beta-lactamase regulating signal transducer with metallopeptidase domain